MVNRSLYLKIIGIVSLIVFLALLGSVLLITGTSYFLSFVCLCIILLITLLLIRWMNGINRKIATFFESVRNGDTALRYPNKTNDPFVKDLYTEMNRIILLFSQNQSEMEEKRLYYESILRVLTHEIRNSITPIRSLSADLLKYSDIIYSEAITGRFGGYSWASAKFIRLLGFLPSSDASPGAGKNRGAYNLFISEDGTVVVCRAG